MSPRQKMINMMYIVLMAMLALNVSVEVLDAFWKVNESLEDGVEQTGQMNSALYADLAAKNVNNAKRFGEAYNKAEEIKAKSNEFYNFLETAKGDILIKAGVLEEGQTTADIPEEVEGSKLQSTQMAGEYFFPGGPLSPKGKELIQLMDDYDKLMSETTKSEAVKGRINKRFNNEPVKNKDGVNVPWIKERFGHYPVAAALTFLSDLQAKVRNSESEVVSELVGAGSKSEITATKIVPVNVPRATSILKGEEYTSRITMAAIDDTKDYKVVVFPTDENGKRTGNEFTQEVVDGIGNIKVPTSSTGEKYWGGVISFVNDEGKTVARDFKFDFNVTEPTAVVSATKMNVLYRGVNNPIDVSVPGVPSNAITVSGPGIRRVGEGKYMAVVSGVSNKTKEVSYTVTATMPSGEKKTFPAKRFRVKNIPAPTGSIRGSSSLTMSKTDMMGSEVKVKLADFDFPVTMTVTGFTLKVPGKPSVTVKGGRFDAKAQRLIKSTSNKSEIIIRNIKYTIKGVNIPLRDASPVIVTISGK